MNLYIDIGTRYIQNMKTCSVYHWNQNRNKAENKCSSLQQRYLFICLFDYKAVCLCKRQNMSKNGLLLQHYWVNFCCLVYLLKKVNIRMWHYLTKYEKVSMSRLKCKYISSYGQRRNISWNKLYNGMVWSFYTFSLDLKI